VLGEAEFAPGLEGRRNIQLSYSPVPPLLWDLLSAEHIGKPGQRCLQCRTRLAGLGSAPVWSAVAATC
jgi:hypothetical protein